MFHQGLFVEHTTSWSVLGHSIIFYKIWCREFWYTAPLATIISLDLSGKQVSVFSKKAAQYLSQTICDCSQFYTLILTLLLMLIIAVDLQLAWLAILLISVNTQVLNVAFALREKSVHRWMILKCYAKPIDIFFPSKQTKSLQVPESFTCFATFCVLRCKLVGRRSG